MTSILSAGTAAASITGVCPDGSVFIVQHPSAVPCRDAKAVDPQDVPPIKPQYLPRPYGWEVFNRKNDPNNPYNLIESRRAARQPTQAPRPQRAEPTPEPRAEQRVQARSEFREAEQPLPAVSRGPTAQAPFGLARSEVSDLGRIVDLQQRRAPASILTRGSGSRLQVARSRAFAERVGSQLDDGADKVVLFSVDTQQSGAFHGNLTFVQGHVAFQPLSSDPSQLGLLRGELGDLRADGPLLGYVVLPASFDLARPMDIYWNDQQVTATLVP
jgi:hypothetical protein